MQARVLEMLLESHLFKKKKVTYLMVLLLLSCY